MENNISTKIRVIGNNFNERDADGNIKVNIAYINKGNMTAKEAKEQIRKVEEYAKQAILLENVSNLATIDNGNTFDRIKKELRKCGYKVYASELNASDYGIPQQRKRLYIVAFRKDLGVKNYRFPKLVALQKYVKDILEPEESIDEKKYVYDLSFVCKGNPDYYSNSPVKLGIIGKGGQGERVYSINGTAITVTAKSGGKFRNTGGYYIDGKLRRLTVRECARLMGFPDSFQLNCSETQAYKLLGNSVVVDVIEYILISMAEALKKVDAI